MCTHFAQTERGQIEALRSSKVSIHEVGRQLGRSASSVTREMRQHMVVHLNTQLREINRYFTGTEQREYAQSRKACVKPTKLVEHKAFIREVEGLTLKEKYSPDAAFYRVGARSGLSKPHISMRTIHRYIHDKNCVSNRWICMCKFVESPRGKIPCQPEHNRHLGLPKFRLHDTRRFNSTVNTEIGLPTVYTQDQLGHSTIRQTLHYQGVRDNSRASYVTLKDQKLNGIRKKLPKMQWDQ
jgi:hypothetical protein